MRARRTALVLSAAVLGAAAALARRRRGRPPLPGLMTATSPNGMEYVAVGTGSRSVLLIPGGPGSGLPSPSMLHFMAGTIRPYLDAGFTVWFVSRRRGMPSGHTLSDIGDDYAQFIADELGGQAEVVVGESYGGMVALYLAADHPDRLGHLALVCSAATLTDWGADFDRRFGEALGTGRDTEVGAAVLELGLGGERWRWLRRGLAPLVGRLAAARTYPPEDALVEAEAERDYDARPVLPRITVPTLLICGDRDEFFAVDAVEETARLIPDATVVWYRGLGHMRVATSSKVAGDVLAFLEQRHTEGST